MVQAAAQAQAVVAAAKSRGDGLVPMSSSQIQALSQIQAQAIVHARKSQGTPQQIQTQIQIQAQALVHAHTQAQIAAGIYKGDDSPPAPAPSNATKGGAAAVPNPVAAAGLKPPPPSSTGAGAGATASTNASAGAMIPASGPSHMSGIEFGEAPAPNSSDPAFLAQLNDSLNEFWQREFRIIQDLPVTQTEQDFKNHNDLPLARIKRIMKSDEDVRMISAEAPVLFSKACELFILDLSIRAWNYSQLHKRRTLQKEDIREAIQKVNK
jgi:nuclear transcription factor Y, gamma